MRNKFFKFNENYASVIKNLDDKQAGQYVKAVADYAFEGKPYVGKDITVKTAFAFTKQKIDEERFYREKGRLGGQKIAERKRETKDEPAALKTVIGGVIAGEMLRSILGAECGDDAVEI